MNTNRYKHSFVFKGAILLTGILLVLWSVKATFEKQVLKAQSSINKQLEYLSSHIDDELISSTEVLYSISNLLNTFERISVKEFNNFTSHLSERKKDILIVEWQPKVLEKDREKFINIARSLGLKDFQMLEPDSNGKLIKAKKRKEHYPVLFALSTKGQEKINKFISMAKSHSHEIMNITESYTNLFKKNLEKSQERILISKVLNQTNQLTENKINNLKIDFSISSYGDFYIQGNLTEVALCIVNLINNLV